MKHKDLIKHLREHGCTLNRHGANHDLYKNMNNGKTSTIPRHKEINNELCKKICKDLDIAKPTRKFS